MRDLRVEALRIGERDQAEPVRADRDRELLEREVVGRAERRHRRRRAGDVRAVRGLEELVSSARVADQAEPVGADRDRGVDVGDALDRGDGRRRAGDVRAMGDFELVEPGVADQGEPVRSDRDRAVAAREVAVERRSLEAGAIEADAAGARRPLWPGLPLRPGIALKALWPCDAGRANESSGPTWPDPT